MSRRGVSHLPLARGRAFAARGAACSAFVVALLVLRGAWAGQSADFVEERYQPSPHPGDYLNLQRAYVPEHLAWGVALQTSYAANTMVFRSPGTGRTYTDALVTGKLSLHILASLALFDYVDVAIAFPFYPMQSGSKNAFLDQAFGDAVHRADIQAGGWGDLRIAPKVRFVHPNWTRGIFSAAVDLSFTAPTGKRGALMSEGGLAFMPRVVFDFDARILNVALNVGFKVRSARQLAWLDVGHEFWLGAAISGYLYRVNLEALAEVEAATALDSFFSASNANYLEGRLGLRYTLDMGLHFLAGGGFGLQNGYGTPSWRFLAGLGFSPRALGGVRDRDKDGINDGDDGCPDVAEDLDGNADSDGCPDDDNDGDGLADGLDACPLWPEDIDGFQDQDGCPDADNDGDGLPDPNDPCPLMAEDVDGFQDQDGCPEPDNDGDRVPDVSDACPLVPEVYNGCADEDGCPDEGRVCITREKIVITDSIHFATGSARILRDSFSLLDEIARIIQGHPELRLIRIEGHTDDRGNENRNLDLSYRRAQAVYKYLVKKRIDRARLMFEGFGQSQPLVPNDSDENRAKNRRVDFIIVEQQLQP